MDRSDIHKASKVRVKQIKFGEPVTNICAGEGNPMRHCYFVEYIRNNGQHLAKCTDKKGKFWGIDFNAIHKLHLSADKCKELWEPVWQAYFK